MQNKENEMEISQIFAYSGIVTLTRKDLEKLKSSSRKAKISMTGLLLIAKDVTPELAEAAIESVHVIGIIRASSAVKDVLRHKAA